MKKLIFLFVALMTVIYVQGQELKSNEQNIILEQNSFKKKRKTSFYETKKIKSIGVAKKSLISLSGKVESESINPEIYLLIKGEKDTTIQLKIDEHGGKEDNVKFIYIHYLPKDYKSLKVLLKKSEYTKTKKISIRVKEIPDISLSPYSLPQTSQETYSSTRSRGACNCLRPTFTSRTGWGCPQSPWSPTISAPSHLVVHHEAPGLANPNQSSNWAQRVLGVWDYHKNTQGWSDIGYNWLIDPNGVLYEGRYLSSSSDPEGAHWSCNQKSSAVCMLGDYSNVNITSSAQNMLVNFLAWKACQHNIDPLSQSVNTAQQGAIINNICGHRDGPCSSTACPGNSLYNQLSSIRNNVNNAPCLNSSGGNTPINDLCSNSVSINNLQVGQCVSASTGEDIANATQSLAPSTNCGGATSVNAFDVWFQFTATCTTHEITVNPSSSMDAAVSLHTTCSGSAIKCSDNGGGLNANEILTDGNFNIGSTYYVRVYDYNNSAGAGSYPATTTFDICINTPSSQCQQAQEDITVQNATVSQSNVSCGDIIDVSVDHVYSGSQLDANLPSFDLDYYFSNNCVLDGNDVLLDDDISGLGSDDPFNNEIASLTIPTGISSGTYYILFVSDADNELIEANENNNITCIPITVTCGGGGGTEDISIQNAAISQSNVNCGDIIDVSADHVYSGSQLDANLPSFDLDYYLSSNCTLEGNDVLLGDDLSGLGSDDPINNETSSLTIPTGISSGTYYILFVSDAGNLLLEANENNNIECVQININCTPICQPLNVSITSNPSTISQGQTSTLSVSPNNASNYQWNVGGVSGANPSVSPQATTTYSVTVTDANGCTGTGSTTVTVNPNNPTCNNSTISLGNNSTSFQAAGMNNHSFNVTFNSSASNCTWSVNQNDCIFVTNLQPSTPQTTSGNVTFNVPANTNTNDRSCTLIISTGNNTENYTITQSGSGGGTCVPPVVDFSVSQTSGPAPLTVDFLNLTSGTQPINYTWTLSGANPQTSNVEEPQAIVYNNQGAYTVRLEATNACGSDQEVKTGFIVVGPVGINEINTLNSLNIYPNPNSGVFTIDIETNKKESFDIIIINSIGQEVYRKNNLKTIQNKLSQKVELNNFSTGVYLVKLLTKSGIASESIIVR